MCSIFKYKNTIGRNFDYEESYDEEIRVIQSMKYYNEYKVIGMCTGLVRNYPLLYDGMNEKGLVMGALAFEGNAVYYEEQDNKINIPSFDFVFQILGGFKSVEDVKTFLNENNVNITNKQFAPKFENSDLHWFVADEKESIIIEQTKEDGLDYYEADVMTNNPPYPLQIELYDSNEIGMTPPFKKKYESRGMETVNLLGDYTSEARFERIKYLKNNLESSDESFNNISQAFHLLSCAEQIYGSTPVKGKYEYSIYSIVYDTVNKKVYLKFYDDLEVEEYGV